jgi:hypothetical protein
MSDLHRGEIQQLMSMLRGQIKKTSEDELEASAFGLAVCCSSLD